MKEGSTSTGPKIGALKDSPGQAPAVPAVQVAELLLSRLEVSAKRTPVEQLFYFFLVDSYRLHLSIRHLHDLYVRSGLPLGSAVDVLLRRLVEQAILTGYLCRQEGEVAALQFLTKYEHEWRRVWAPPQLPTDVKGGLPQLPNKSDMANAVDPALRHIYRMTSNLAHADETLPYSLNEWEAHLEGVAAVDFYLARNADLIDISDAVLGKVIDDFLVVWRRELPADEP